MKCLLDMLFTSEVPTYISQLDLGQYVSQLEELNQVVCVLVASPDGKSGIVYVVVWKSECPTSGRAKLFTPFPSPLQAILDGCCE